MTATVTTLIDLASQHGFGVAFLVVGAQLILDRLVPVERVVGLLAGVRKPAHPHGAHRRARTDHSALGRNEKMCFSE
jgi:hypothetical protein